MCPGSTLSPRVWKAVDASDRKRYHSFEDVLQYFCGGEILKERFTFMWKLIQTPRLAWYDDLVVSVCVVILSFYNTEVELCHSVNILFRFSDCDSVRFQASSYAALHRGRPPERPLNCKNPPQLGWCGLVRCYCQ